MQKKIFYNGTILAEEGAVQNGYVSIKNGIIEEVGQGAVPSAFNDYQKINLQDMYLSPGFIDAHSHLGLDNYGMGFEGHVYNEMGDIVAAHLRGIDSFNPLELGVRRALDCGVTTVGTGPGSANALGGTFFAV